jgi:hypothetical protein
VQVLNKYVGQSEENIRNLFAEADAEYKEKVGLNVVWLAGSYFSWL